MIYLDSSVVLAHLLVEDRMPPTTIWNESLVSSRLLEYEVFTRLNARRLTASHGEAARALLHRLALLELAPPVLARALEPFKAPVRTLDALHLASIEFLRSQRVDVTLASYDERQLAAARAIGIPVMNLAA
jgi:predicted nucleic acid-binding protein